MTYTREIGANLGPAQAGLAGVLGYTVIGTDGAVLVARTTSGVVEVGPGLYAAAVAGWDASWAGRVQWDAGAGVLAIDTFEPDFARAATYAGWTFDEAMIRLAAGLGGKTNVTDLGDGLRTLAFRTKADDGDAFTVTFDTNTYARTAVT